MNALVQTHDSAGVFSIVLNRPEKMNALSAQIVEQLIAALEQAHAAKPQVIVLRGEGKNFSAGFDFSDVAQQSEGDLLLRFVRIETLLQQLSASPCMTVALAHGRNFGAGVDLFAACRLRYCTPETTFRMPGLKFGLVLGTRRFGSLVGVERARDLLETSATFDGKQAHEMGFVRQLAGPGEWDGLLAQARERAGQLAPASRAALYDTLADHAFDEDMARLVRSAAEPGIKDRVAAYMQAR
jgi:enoyl-CoA hydratase/carnithine racemase